jgi:hypothetical protein
MRLNLLLGAFGVALLGTSAAAQFGPPPYRQQPSKEELAAAFPPQALQKGVDGVAAATCKVTSDGALEGCKLLQETPTGFGFGAALLSLAPKYRLPEKFQAPGGVFRLQQRFDPPKSRYASWTLIGNPTWLGAPSTGDVAKAFAGLPPGSAPAELMFRCEDEGNALKNCELVRGPASAAYEAAARPLLEKFRPAPRRREALTTGPTIPSLQKTQPRPFLYLTIAMEPAPTSGEVGYLEQPEWLQGPTPAQLKAAFPAKAAGAGLQQGQAGLDCRLDATGHLTDCRVTAENPKDMGFGAAALSLAPLMAVNPWTDDGHSIEGVRVEFALGFNR